MDGDPLLGVSVKVNLNASLVDLVLDGPRRACRGARAQPRARSTNYIYLPIYIYLSIYLSLYLSIYLSIYLSLYRYMYI